MNKNNIAFEFENIKIHKDHPLDNCNSNVISGVATFKGNIIVGSIVEYPSDIKMIDVHYLKKYTADNKHSSGWIKLEMRRPQKGKILLSRLIDRSIRPLVKDKSFQMIISLIDNDSENNPTKAILTLASYLIYKAGYVDKMFLPYYKKWGQYYLVAISYNKGLIMIEASLNKMPYSELREHLITAANLTEKIDNKSKYLTKNYSNIEPLKNIFPIIKKLFLDKISIYEAKLKIGEFLEESEKRGIEVFNLLNSLLSVFYKSYGRIDKRAFNELRKIVIEPYILKTPYINVLVKKGSTKILTSMILSCDPQQVDESTISNYKEYLNVQYDMLGHSVGQTARLNNFSRREIGHANLIFNAVQSLKKPNEIAAYIQNDVISCDGSSSMTSTMGTSISMFLGNLSEEVVFATTIGRIGDVLISDINGIEDWLGNMDFKITGQSTYITAIQLDVKGNILKSELIDSILDQSKNDLDLISKQLKDQIKFVKRKDYYSLFFKNELKIKEDKVKFLIGYAGYNIKKMEKLYNVNISIDKASNKIEIKGEEDKTHKAKEYFESILRIPELNEEIEAVVVTIMKDSALLQPDNSISGFAKIENWKILNNSKVKAKVINVYKDKIEYEILKCD